MGNDRCFEKFNDYNLSTEPVVRLKDILAIPFNFNSGLVSFNSDLYGDKCVAMSSHIINLIFELVRKSEFPDRPSRFQSMFVWKSLDEAVSFKNEQKDYHGSKMSIYKVSALNFFEADMMLLRSGANLPDILNFACRYWSGEKSQNPKMEILAGYPIEVIGVVKTE